jgi:hypothetical protein
MYSVSDFHSLRRKKKLNVIDSGKEEGIFKTYETLESWKYILRYEKSIQMLKYDDE